MFSDIVLRIASSGLKTASSGWQQIRRNVLLVVVVVSIGFLMTDVPAGMTAEAHRLVAVTVLMAGLWVTQVLPMAATSLIPLALFPLLGIMPAADVSKAFVNETLFLYLGGMVIALGIERWNLHERIALTLVSIVGVSPRRLVLGFMVTSTVLSMWISNTACTLLMVPIALAMLRTLENNEQELTQRHHGRKRNPEKTRDSDATTSSSGMPRLQPDRLATPLLLAIAYASSLGGMTTLVGTPTNSSALGIYHDTFPDAARLTVADWLLVCGPIGVVYLMFTWWLLTFRLPPSSPADAQMRVELRQRLRQLGQATVPELRMLLVFGGTALLWVFRNPLDLGGILKLPGWLDWYKSVFELLGTWRTGQPVVFPAGAMVADSTIAMAVAVLLFFLPSGTRNRDGQPLKLMDWPTANRLPWDMILLFGGGFALADAFRTTELSRWLGEVLRDPLSTQPAWAVVGALCLLMTFLTEFTSNVATVNTLMPTVLAMAAPLGMDARMLFIPVTLAASCAFMMPIATPPNAIVFGSGRINIRQMAGYGLILNLAGVVILTLGTFVIIRPLLGIK